jgi:CxxC-x17-CxxC domain-containing protein
MNNFNHGPGGLRARKEFIGGRPKSDANYGPKKNFAKKSFNSNHRKNHSSFSGSKSGGDRRPVELFKTTCTTCGKSCEVPFRPDGSKPVLCSECFGKNRSDERNGADRNDRFSNDRPQRKPEREFQTPRPERGPSPDYKAFQQQISVLENKVNEMLEILKATQKEQKAKISEVDSSDGVIAAKVRKPKKAEVKKVVKKTTKKVTKKK